MRLTIRKIMVKTVLFYGVHSISDCFMQNIHTVYLYPPKINNVDKLVNFYDVGYITT